MTAAELRAMFETGAALTLPSGLKVSLRPVDPLTLAMAGQIPQPLKGIVAEMMFAPLAQQDEARDEIERRLHISADQMPVVDAVCRAALLSPRVVDSPTYDDEISLDYLPILDRTQIYWWVTQGAIALQTFRDEQNADVGPLPDGGEVGPEAEQLAAHA